MGECFVGKGGGGIDLSKFGKGSYLNGTLAPKTHEIDLSALGEGIYILSGLAHYNQRSQFRITSPSTVNLDTYSIQAMYDAASWTSQFVVLVAEKVGTAYDVYALGKTSDMTKYLILSGVTTFTFNAPLSLGYFKLDYGI